MSIRVAINGYGRIGRNILRACFEANREQEIEIVAINDLGPVASLAHLTKYDSTHGRFNGDVAVEGSKLIVNGKHIAISAQRDPAQCSWFEHDIDVVYECTGFFASKEKASAHLQSGAKKVLISAPGGSDVDATIVYGVNHDVLRSSFTVVSNASCTTNCLAPVAKPLNDAFGMVSGLMTTIHAYTNDQVLSDMSHKDLRRARSATQSMIPTNTGAAAAVGLVLPELAGKCDGYAVRVPTLNVSLVDLSFISKKKTTVEEVNKVLMAAAESAPLHGVLGVTYEPLVSIDFNHDPLSATVDASQTKVVDHLVKVIAWYDNEWGFSNRMLDTTAAWMSAK